MPTMATVSYRLALYVGALVSLAACTRSSYQFAVQATYLPTSAVALVPTATPSEVPRAVCSTLYTEVTTVIQVEHVGSKAAGSTPVPRPVRLPENEEASHCQPQALTSSYQPLMASKRLLAKPAPTRATANYGPYFSSPTLGAALLLLALLALLFTALLAGAVALLVKLIVHLTRGKARRSACLPAAPPTRH